MIHLRNLYSGDQSKLIFGNTRVELERQLSPIKPSSLISITLIKELQELKRNETSLHLGAGVTFARLKSQLNQWNNENPNSICQVLLDQIRYFASTQIRNVASLGGNIIAAAAK